MTFRELMESHGVACRGHKEHHHARLGWIQTDCPSCSPGSHRFRLGWNVSEMYFACWKCGPQRRAETIASLLGVTLSAAFYHLRQLGYDFAAALTPATERAPQQLVLPIGLGPLGDLHKEYLSARGFDPDAAAEKYGLQGTTWDSDCPWSIFIPCRVKGHTVSWTTRSIESTNTRRYMSAAPTQEVLPLKEQLFNADSVKWAVSIHEGPFDAMKIGDGAVAIMGLAITAAQVRQLAAYPCRTIAFDNEPLAFQRAMRLSNALVPYPGLTRVVKIDSDDPAEMPPDEVAAFRKLAYLD